MEATRVQRLPRELQLELSYYLPEDYNLGATPAYRDTYLQHLAGMRPLREDIEHYRRGCNVKIKYRPRISASRPPWISVTMPDKLVRRIYLGSLVRTDLIRLLKETDHRGFSNAIKAGQTSYLFSRNTHGVPYLVWRRGGINPDRIVPYCTEVIEALLHAADSNQKS